MTWYLLTLIGLLIVTNGLFVYQLFKLVELDAAVRGMNDWWSTRRRIDFVPIKTEQGRFFHDSRRNRRTSNEETTVNLFTGVNGYLSDFSLC